MSSVQRSRIAQGMVVLLGIGIVAVGGYFSLSPKYSTSRVASASQPCPFTVDGDGGTPGIQVTSNITVSAVSGDYYNCTGLIEIVSPTVVTLDSDVDTGAIAEIHFVDLQVDSGAVISADAKGCAAVSGERPGRGPNTSTNICAVSTSGAGDGSFGPDSAGGGGYGAYGGNGQQAHLGGAPYGSNIAPVLFGSSGGTSMGVQNGAGLGGRGGGVVRLAVSGTFTHNGILRANGANGGSNGSYSTGGGSGGSVYVSAATIDGTTGFFQSTGGSVADVGLDSGGGGGGRIAVIYNAGSFAFGTARFDAAGGTAGTAAYPGLRGTVFVDDDNGTTGTMTDDVVTVYEGFSFDNTAYSVSSWTAASSATNQYCLAAATTPSLTAPTIVLSGAMNCSPTNLTNMTISSSGTVAMTDFTFTVPNQKFFLLNGGADVSLAGSTTINGNVKWTGLASVDIGASTILNANAFGCTDLATDAAGWGPDSSNVCTYATGGAGTSSTSLDYGGGGGYGGPGGNSFGNTGIGVPYGTDAMATFADMRFGSSGASGNGSGNGVGPGATGGGLIRIEVSGTFTTAGTVRANGNNGNVNGGFTASGGSGGSISVSAGAFEGTTGSSFAAKGGNGGDSSQDSGGGGGGRIALVYNTGSYPFSSARFDVAGGTTGGSGSATAGSTGTVMVTDNAGTSGSTSDDAVTVYRGFSFDDTDYSVASWTTDSSATDQYCFSTATTPSITAATISFAGAINCTAVSANNFVAPTNLTNFTVSSSTTVGMTGFTFTIPGKKFFMLSGGAAVTLSGSTTINANTQWTGLGSLNVGSSSILNANGYGCSDSAGDFSGYGPTDPGNVCTYATTGAGVGTSGPDSASGGGHGGAGGPSSQSHAGGTTYDAESAPLLFGSSGGTSMGGANGVGAGGSGGGVIRLDVTGTLTNSGTIRANGSNGGSNGTYSTGAGSGGSIYITVGTVVCATGSFNARGGNAAVVAVASGGGGGGRIAIHYTTDSTSSSCLFNDGVVVDTIGGLGASTYAAGGTAYSGGAGVDGTLLLNNTAPVVTTPTLTNAMTFSRLQVSASGTFAVSFALQGTRSGVLTVTFPVGFTVTAMTGAGSSGCLGTFGYTSSTIYATKTACSGTIVLAGATVTNPSSPGSYLVTWVNDDPGSALVAIVDSDTVSMSASVDPFITVNVGSQASGTACDGTFAGAGGAFALGALSTGSVTSSDASSVPHICLRVSTNASSGAVATVKSLNGNLKSTAVPADTIPSNSVTLTAGTAGYGLCVGSGGGDTGLDTTVPTGASPARTSPFDGSCTSSAHVIGALTTSAQPVIVLASPTQNAFARIYLKAGISTLTKAHLDYADTLTFIVTGTF